MKKIERLSGLEIHANPKLYSQLFTPYEPINKMLEDAVEVYGYKVGRSKDIDWRETDYHNEKCPVLKKALLINIEPIKQETCADVLRDLMQLAKEAATHGSNVYNSVIINKAKAALDRESDK